MRYGTWWAVVLCVTLFPAVLNAGPVKGQAAAVQANLHGAVNAVADARSLTGIGEARSASELTGRLPLARSGHLASEPGEGGAPLRGGHMVLNESVEVENGKAIYAVGVVIPGHGDIAVNSARTEF